MNSYVKPVEIRWSDLDPNFHVRHSVYYDWGAYARICFLTDHGLGAGILVRLQLGPILLREECVFKREVLFGDAITVNLVLKQCTTDFSRWTMQHEIMKNDETISAIITIDGAWLDTAKRKLAAPGEIVSRAFELIPKAADFMWVERKA